MDNSPEKVVFFVVESAKYHKLTVVAQIYDIRNHPLYEQTPQSYIQQGRLWECKCECGVSFLVSEHSLSRGKHKSCGCMRYGKRPYDIERKRLSNEYKIRKMEIDSRIKVLRFELATLKTENSLIRDEKRIDLVAADLRSAYARKASLVAKYYKDGSRKRKIVNPDKIVRLRELELISELEEKALKHAAREIEKQRGLS
jgi:hypothetical protein